MNIKIPAFSIHDRGRPAGRLTPASRNPIRGYLLALAAQIVIVTTAAHAAESPGVRTAGSPATGAAGATAAGPAGAVIEEMVVTADFYDAPMMSTPGSIQIVDARTIDERQARHLEDVLNTVANVTYSKASSRPRFVQIRGIGDLEQFVDPKHFPSVGIVIDGIDMSGVANSASLFDVHQIEFFRGPQGTRFGTSALAGSIQVRSNEPTEDFDASVTAGYGNYDTWNVGGVVSGPLTDQLAGRFAVQRLESDGYQDNKFLNRDDTSNYEETILRGKLRWTSSREDFAVHLTGFYSDSDNGYDAFSLDNNRDTVSDEPGRDKQETLALGLGGEWRLDNGLLVETLFTVSDTDLNYDYDEDWTFVGFCDGTSCDPVLDFFSNTDQYHRERTDYALDLRVSSDFREGMRFVAGLYGQRRNEDLERDYYGKFTSDYDTERYATYGQIDWQLGEAWQLTTGLRYEYFSDDYNDSNTLDLDSDDTLWGGELTLQRTLGDTSLIYATLALGNKPGGINTEVSSVGAFVRPELQPYLQDRTRFDSETLLNREIGFKGRYLDNRLALRLAAFYMDRDNAQLESWVWDAANFIWVGMLDTTSDGANYGLELDGNYTASDRLELFASIGLLHADVDKITTFNLDTDDFETQSGRDQTKAPQYQFNVGANLALTRRISARIEVEGQDNSFYGYYHEGKLDAYELLNASLAYTGEQLEVRLWGRNITDEDYQVHGLYFGNDPREGWVPESYYQFGEPAVYGLSLTYQLR